MERGVTTGVAKIVTIVSIIVGRKIAQSKNIVESFSTCADKDPSDKIAKRA